MNLKQALKDPASVFDSPDAVLAHSELNDEQKRAILEQWERDARLLEAASAENMAGGEPNLLHTVLQALQKLGH